MLVQNAYAFFNEFIRIVKKRFIRRMGKAGQGESIEPVRISGNAVGEEIRNIAWFYNISSPGEFYMNIARKVAVLTSTRRLEKVIVHGHTPREAPEVVWNRFSAAIALRQGSSWLVMRSNKVVWHSARFAGSASQ